MHLSQLFRRRRNAASATSAWQPGIPVRMRVPAPDAYLLPRDAREIHRLDFQHYLLRQVLKGNYVTPLDHTVVASMVDVGCGTGRWAQEMALAFPLAEVIGFDLAQEYQVALPGIGGNYHFQQGNLLDGLPFPDQRFDFTHQRFLVAAIPAAKWPFVLSELVRVTRYGRWIELVEASDSYVNPGPFTMRFLSWWTAFSQIRGFDASLIRHLGEGLQHAGLHHIHTRTIELPVGPWMWGKQREGLLLQQNMLAAFSGLKDLLCSVLSLAPEAFDQVLAGLPQEWANYRTRYHMFVAYGQR